MPKRPQYKHRKHRVKSNYGTENAKDRSQFSKQMTVQGRKAFADHDYKDQTASREGRGKQAGKYTASATKLERGQAYKR